MLCFLIVFIQDWRYRRIHLVLPIIIFVLSYFAIERKHKSIINIMGFNLAFLLITLSFLIIYMSLKNKKILNPFQNYFGIGDLLFYIAVTPLFLLKNYILFFILSMVFAIVLQIILRKVISEKTVPLAGFTAVFLLLLVLSDTIFDLHKITLL